MSRCIIANIDYDQEQEDIRTNTIEGELVKEADSDT